MKLYNYYLSSASFRVRIALNLKGLDWEYVGRHLRNKEHRAPDYLALNPQGFVPALVTDQGDVLLQSVAIMEWLEDTHPTPALLPTDALGRARVRAITQLIACDIHPLNNLRVLQYLVGPLKLDEEAKNGWYRHWVTEGFEALEKMLANDPATGRFCHGDQPTMADCCLVPQIFNAKRFDVDLTPYPTIRRILDACMALPAFDKAQPSNCPET